MENDTLLKPSALAPMWNISERQTRNVLAQLERLGFKLETDYHGGRQLPLTVATVVKAVRQAGLELSTLRDRPDMAPFLRPDAAPAADTLTDLLEMRAEVAILREVLAELHKSLSQGSQRLGYVAPQSWSFVGVPDPKRGL
jgi:hypothetical protein